MIDLERKWRSHAACVGVSTEVFFPPQSQDYKETSRIPPKTKRAWDKAKAICATCPVRPQCARDTLGETEGVWGGLDPQERKRLRKIRARSVKEMPEGRAKAELAKTIYGLRVTAKLDTKDVSRILGINPALVMELYAWHLSKIRDDAAAKAAVLALPAEGEGEEEILWPTQPPLRGDSWVRYMGRVVRAYYLGETENSEWFSMRIARLEGGHSIGWFRACDVKVMTSNYQVLERVGDTSRVYGTRLSESSRRHAR